MNVVACGSKFFGHMGTLYLIQGLAWAMPPYKLRTSSGELQTSWQGNFDSVGSEKMRVGQYLPGRCE